LITTQLKTGVFSIQAISGTDYPEILPANPCFHSRFFYGELACRNKLGGDLAGIVCPVSIIEKMKNVKMVFGDLK
jgi:hypothetical protein